MLEITKITSDTFQRHVITTADAPVEIKLRFYPRAQFWTLDVKYKGYETKGLKLSLGTLHMRSRNMPFDFIVNAASGSGIDPFAADDFSGGRCNLLMLDRADMESIRGQPIQI